MSHRASAFRGGVGILGLLVLCAIVHSYLSPTPSAAVVIEPAFGFGYRGERVADMQFSPDGRKLALLTFETDRPDRYTAKVAVRIYAMPGGTLEHEIASGAWKCAWSKDGSVLAIPQRNAIDIDLWDTRSWTIKQTLHVTYPKSVPDPRPDISRLCFDQKGNFYLAEFEQGWEASGFSTTYEYSPRVWWNLGDHWSRDEERFGSCTHPTPYSDSIAPYDLSVSWAGQQTRVAFTSWNCWAQILKVRQGAKGMQSVELDFSFRVGGWIKLTPDGEYLAVFGNGGGKEERPGDAVEGVDEHKITGKVRVFYLSADHAELIGSRTVAATPSVRSGTAQLLDVSGDGRFAAICTHRRIEVVRIPSCEPVAEIPQELKSNTSITFAPAGQLLAVADQERRAISFYRVPRAVK
jgi:hypothetical protein